MTQQNWKNSIAITGAGSGFGSALAHHYASEGWKVAVTDINEQRARQTLSELEPYGGNHLSMLLDITKADHWQQLEDAVVSQWGGLEVLINNAGVAAAGNIEDTSIEDWDWVLDIDLMGVVRGCHQFAGLMKRQKSGHIVNVSSFAGLAGLPFIAAYGVAKAGVVALSEALRAEMHPHGVGVTVACPAFVKTGLLDTFRSDKPDTKAKVTKWMETSGVSAGQVAMDIAQAIRKNQFLLLTHAQTRAAWRMKRWLPERYFRMIAKRTSG
ncbi:MAG: SDR family oxidoreductase [Gammaproteobacteria bacterium]|nr:SDR family oxidoreductase [Gammaproteobacteria bacterium]